MHDQVARAISPVIEPDFTSRRNAALSVALARKRQIRVDGHRTGSAGRTRMT